MHEHVRHSVLTLQATAEQGVVNPTVEHQPASLNLTTVMMALFLLAGHAVRTPT